MIAKLTKAGAADTMGATTNISLSALRGTMSSLSGSLIPSSSDWSRPNGPARFGPGRCCIRPMTRRSAQIANSVMTIRKMKTNRTLMTTSHQGW